MNNKIYGFFQKLLCKTACSNSFITVKAVKAVVGRQNLNQMCEHTNKAIFYFLSKGSL